MKDHVKKVFGVIFIKVFQSISRPVMTSFSINPVLCQVAVFDKNPKFWTGKAGMVLCTLLQNVQFREFHEPVINILGVGECMKSAVQFRSVSETVGRWATPPRKIRPCGYFHPLIVLSYRYHPLKPLSKVGRPGIFQKIKHGFLPKAGARGNL